MNLRDMGDKQGGRTWWGIALLAIYGGLELVDKHFGGMMPEPWGPVLTDGIGWLGGIIVALGLGRKAGKVVGAVKGR